MNENDKEILISNLEKDFIINLLYKFITKIKLDTEEKEIIEETFNYITFLDTKNVESFSNQIIEDYKNDKKLLLKIEKIKKEYLKMGYNIKELIINTKK